MTPIPSTLMPRRPLWQRINLRMVLFGLVVVALIGGPAYVYLDSVVSGGVKDIGNGYKLCDLKAMSLFPLDQQNGTIKDIPEKWRALDGQKVVLYGEMWDPLSARDASLGSFQLCYSIAKCCFNGPPQVQHFVSAHVVPGHNVDYHDNLVKVTGILHVKVINDAGKLSSIYQLDCESVEPM